MLWEGQRCIHGSNLWPKAATSRENHENTPVLSHDHLYHAVHATEKARDPHCVYHLRKSVLLAAPPDACVRESLDSSLIIVNNNSFNRVVFLRGGYSINECSKVDTALDLFPWLPCYSPLNIHWQCSAGFPVKTNKHRGGVSAITLWKITQGIFSHDHSDDNENATN